MTLFLGFLVALVQMGFEDRVMTLFAVVILTVSLAPFYLPTRYVIAEDTVTVRTPFSKREKRLKLFRRWQADRHGILLSPFDRPSRLDRFHGLNLRFDASDRERVTEYIRRRFAGHDGEG